MSSVAEILGLPPGVQFSPDDQEVVELYLLPLARGEPAPFPGVAILNDDAAGRTLPWALLDRHGLGRSGGGDDDDGPYFFLVRCSGDATKPGARQERRCDGGAGTWKSQKRHVEGTVRLGAAEEVHWTKHSLNLHVSTGGSVGWVMHEYVLTDQSFPPLKILRFSFSGHGKNRERVPGSGDCQSERAAKRARIDAAAAAGGGSASSGSGGSTTTTVDQDYSGEPRASADGQELAQGAVLTGQDVEDWVDKLLSDDFPGMSFPASADGEPACCFEEHVVQAAAPPATEQQVPDHAMTMPLPTVQETAGTLEFFAPPAGITLDEFSDMAAGIGNMTEFDAGAQLTSSGVSMGGFHFEFEFDC